MAAKPNYSTVNPNDHNIFNEGNEGYFVDEEGRYYYVPENKQLSILTINEASDDYKINEQKDVRMNISNVTTATLVPSQTVDGDVTYVLVVQESDEVQEQQKEEDDVSVDYDIKHEENSVSFSIEDSSDSDYEEQAPPLKRSKANKSQYSCQYCKYTSPRRYLLLRHMLMHSSSRPLKCTVCERGFKTVVALQNHVNVHNGVKPHHCKECEMRFTTSGELVRHTRYKHTLEKPHKCTVCDYASVERSKLRRHVRSHTGERPYQCSHCTYASPDNFKLKRHLRTHTGEKPYKCSLCTRAFTQSNSLKAHKLIHDFKAKPVYACALCSTTCGRKTDLRIHVQKLHTSDQPLECGRCHISCPDKYTLRNHTKTHKDDKFSCNVCPYTSNVLRHLKSHMLKHTDEKPFVCDVCDASFRQKQLLKRHKNIYHNPDYVPSVPKEKTHECRECNRLYAHKGNLIRHMAVHDPESNYQERALALKLGRQKKIQLFIEAESSNQETSSEEEEKAETYKAMTDVRRYVVFEVIDLENSNVDAVNNDEENNENPTVIVKFQPKFESQDIKSEIETCFGFDLD